MATSKPHANETLILKYNHAHVSHKVTKSKQISDNLKDIKFAQKFSTR